MCGATASTTRGTNASVETSPGNVTTGLHTLRDYYIDIRLCRALRVRDRTDLMENFAAASVNAIDIWRRISPEKRNDRHTLRHTNRDPFIDRKM
jgi:hypothetical protein